MMKDLDQSGAAVDIDDAYKRAAEETILEREEALAKELSAMKNGNAS